MKKLFGLFFFLFILCSPSLASASLVTTDKLITVDTTKQMIYAWERGRVVYEAPVATGLPKSPTVKGTFKIYLKYENQAHMKGYSPYIGWYDFKNVPYVMYFYKGYGVHGAYWHNNFGTRRSNGCVNLPVYAAKWFYDFAPLGTTVIVF